MIKKIVLLLFCSLTLVTCKKGDDDPAISLKSRKTRLAGEWVLEGGKLNESAEDHINTIRYTTAFTFTSNKYTAIESVPYYQEYRGTYIVSLTIDKNGTFSFREQFDSRELKGEGVWDFLNKSDGVKKKEEVNFIIGKLEKGSTNNYHLFNWGFTTMRYRIKELRDKKLVLTVAEDAIINPKKYDLSYTGEFVFTQ